LGDLFSLFKSKQSVADVARNFSDPTDNINFVSVEVISSKVVLISRWSKIPSRILRKNEKNINLFSR
jgi:hypothetical protein